MGESLNLLPASYSDFRRAAEKRLPRFLFDYIDGGAGAEVTLRRNTADWEAVQLTQKVLRDASKLDCSVELFGQKLAMPRKPRLLRKLTKVFSLRSLCF